MVTLPLRRSNPTPAAAALTLPLPPGQAYLVRSVDNMRIGISRLTSDYLNTTSRGEISRAPRAEAPVIWRDPPSRP